MIQRSALFRNFLVGVILVCTFGPAWPSDDGLPLPQELAAFVAQPDPSFEWHAMTSGHLGSAQYTEYLMTSQTWRGIPWKHQLFVVRPGNMPSDVRHALLFIHGGRWKPEYEAERKDVEMPREAALFVRLAESIRAPVVVLRQVPFQPMFERREDALIAYTFDQYLQTGESDWPVLLPMVKSASRAMDAVQKIVQEGMGATIESFTVAGASKRGWTSWLISAIDKRVMAVAPMVIDVLNMPAQMDHQRATWGDFSEQIRDYSSLDLPTRLKSPRGQALLSMVDPFSYRAQLTQPKFILLSTNDRYWPLDALNLYWPGLLGPKNVLYVPNQGHGLRDADRVIGAVSAVHRYAAEGKSLPRTSWSFGSARHALTIQVKSDRPPQHVLIWSASSSSLDFREAHWTSQRCSKSNGGYNCRATRATKGYTAAYAESAFRDKGSPDFSTTTTVCIVSQRSDHCDGF